MSSHLSAVVVGAVATGALLFGRQTVEIPKGRVAVTEKHANRRPDELDKILLESAHHWIALRRSNPDKVKRDAKMILPRIRALLSKADLDIRVLQAVQCIEVGLTGEGEIMRFLDSYQDTPPKDSKARWAPIRQVPESKGGTQKTQEKDR